MANLLSSASNIITGGTQTTSSNRHPGIASANAGDKFQINDWESLGKIAANIALNAASISQAARTVYCTGMAIKNPMMLLNTVELMAAGAGSIALDMAERMAKLVTSQLTQALSQINGVFKSLTTNALGYIEGLRTFLESIKNYVQAFRNFVDNIKVGANVEYEEFCSKEDCEFMFAMMAACLLSKLVGNKLQDFERKVSTEITNKGSELNKALADGMKDISNFSGYLEREKFMMEKAAKQLDGLHRTIGISDKKIEAGPLTINNNIKLEEENSEKKAETERKSNIINQATEKIKNNSVKKETNAEKLENKYT